ncbi:hypothetical protein H4582DRAFT_1793114, partial [Lactarius indigo]
WTAERQVEFSQDMLRAWISAGIPFNAASDLEMAKFIAKYIPAAHIPDRRALSGRFLDKEVERVENHLKSKLDGKIATGQCDGWKNIAKASVVASMVTVDYEPFLIRTHDISANRKTGDNLLKLVLDDILYVKNKYGVVIIAWVTDDGGDGRRMRRLLLTFRPDLIVILCWAHQINL